MSRLYYEQEDDEIPQKAQVELQVLEQYWVKISPEDMFNSEHIECYVDIESQSTARQTMERIKRYIETHYYNGEYTIINMCKL